MIIKYQHTEQSYRTKPEKGSEEWKKLTWTDGKYTYDDLIDHLKSNHFYRAHFRSTSNFGTKEFVSAQVIFLDYDNGETTMDKYVSELKVQPSFYYRSHSSDETGNKFRIGYVLDKPIYSAEEFRVISTAIADNIGGGLTSKDFDPKSFSPYQLWCGAEYGIHDNSFFFTLDKVRERILQDDPKAFDFKKKETHRKTSGERRKLTQEEQEIKDDFFRLRYDDFIVKYISKPIVCSTPIKENEAFYFYDKNNYFEIIRKYQINEEGRMSHYKRTIRDGYEPLRFVNGERRRNKISTSVSFIHQIKPEISLSELLAQTIFYINHYIDNTDDSITNDWIWNMVFDEYIQPKRYSCTIKKSYSLKREFFSEMKDIHHKKKIKEYKKEYCLSLYDDSTSLENNLNVINSYLEEETNGVMSVSERTLKGYLKEEGIPFSEIQKLKLLSEKHQLTKEILLESYRSSKINRKTYFKYKKLLE